MQSTQFFPPEYKFPAPQCLGVAQPTKKRTRGGNRLGTKNFAKWKREYLINWLRDHRENPYPTHEEKDHLGSYLGMSRRQI